MKTKKIIIFKTFICISLMIMFYSCDDGIYPTTPSKFIIQQIKINKAKVKGTSAYFVTPIEVLDLNINSTWFIDSVGKFNVGDTVSFQRNY